MVPDCRDAKSTTKQSRLLDLSVRLKELRLEKRLRQDQLAALVGLEKPSISMYENDMRQPSYETLVRFADVFNVTVDYLLGRRNDRQLDLSGLTAAEATIISDIIASMPAACKPL